MNVKHTVWGKRMIKTAIGLCIAASVLGIVSLHQGAIIKEQDIVSPETVTYQDAAAAGDGFLMVGTAGQIVWLNQDGMMTKLQGPKAEQLSGVIVSDEYAISTGLEGSVLRIDWGNGTIEPISELRNPLFCGCLFDELWLVGSTDGTVYSSIDGVVWNPVVTGASGDIMGLAASEERCVAVTDSGEIAVTEDGTSWNAMDYNQYYGEAVRFSGVEWIQNQFWAYGTDDHARSRVIQSVQGNVWNNRDLNIYGIDSVEDASLYQITDIGTDGTQAIATTDAGKVLVLPGCTTCNTLREISSEPLYAVAGNGTLMLFGGANGTAMLENSSQIRQNSIRAERARELIQNGALLIDVRTQDEYDSGHIPGSIRVEPEQLTAQLPALAAKEQTLIFYCASGVRSRKALEIAQELGYRNVYDLGAISNWKYEIVGLDEDI